MTYVVSQSEVIQTVILLFPVVLLVMLNGLVGHTAIEYFSCRDMLLDLLVSPRKIGYRFIYHGSIFFTGATASTMAPDCVQYYEFPVFEMLDLNR
jgi:hypothetical protein